MKGLHSHPETRDSRYSILSPLSLIRRAVPGVPPAAPIALFLVAMFLLTGCASSQTVSDESSSATAVVLSGESDSTDEKGFTISALETELQDQGVFVMPRGQAGFGIPAEQSAQLLLNSSEVLHVFEFARVETARDQAYAFAGANPRRSVYVRDELVAIRLSRGDTGLAQTLRDILGEAL